MSPSEQSRQRLSFCVPICEWHEENETALQYVKFSTPHASCNMTQMAKLPSQPTTATCFASGNARMLRTQIFSYSISKKKLSGNNTNPTRQQEMFLHKENQNKIKTKHLPGFCNMSPSREMANLLCFVAGANCNIVWGHSACKATALSLAAVRFTMYFSMSSRLAKILPMPKQMRSEAALIPLQMY